VATPELICVEPTELGCVLPVRPRPYVDELTHGFLVRVAQANGYEKPSLLLSIMRHKGVKGNVALRHSLRLTEGEYSCLAGPWPQSCGCDDKLLIGLNRADYTQTFFRWCPLCLIETPYLRSAWAIKFGVTCLNHGSYLIDSCPRCHCQQRVENFAKLRCACGHSLTACDVLLAPADVLELQAVFLTNAGFTLIRGIPQLKPAAWVLLYVRIAELIAPNRHGRTGPLAGLHRLSIAVAVVERTAQFLMNGANGLHSLLAEIQAKRVTSFSLVQTFGRLYRWLYADLASSEFAFLREAFERYLREHWWGLVCRRNQRISSSTNQQRVTIQEAAKRSGISPSYIKQLHLVGVIEATTVEYDSGRQSWSLPESAVTNLMDMATDGMTLKAAASFLALPKHRIRELIDAGLIRPRLVAGQHGSVWHISSNELNRLGRPAAKQDCIQQHNQSSDDSVTLVHVLKTWRLPAGAFPALINALVADEIENFEVAQGDTPLGQLRVPVKPVKAWLLKWKSLHQKTMPINAAARVLGIKEQAAYDLVRVGLLQSHARKNSANRQVTTEGIRQFQDRYVMATEISRALGISPKALLTKIAIQPVTGPMIDGSRQYFYKRSDVAHLLRLDRESEHQLTASSQTRIKPNQSNNAS
jgi:TniQ